MCKKTNAEKPNQTTVPNDLIYAAIRILDQIEEKHIIPKQTTLLIPNLAQSSQLSAPPSKHLALVSSICRKPHKEKGSTSTEKSNNQKLIKQKHNKEKRKIKDDEIKTFESNNQTLGSELERERVRVGLGFTERIDSVRVVWSQILCEGSVN